MVLNTSASGCPAGSGRTSASCRRRRSPRPVGDRGATGPISQRKSAKRSIPISPWRTRRPPGTRGLVDADRPASLELLERRHIALEVALHQIVVGHDDPLDQVVVHLVLERLHVVGDLAVRDALPSA